jgi:CubicO group peptidase (beta-lactamase class C family)
LNDQRPTGLDTITTWPGRHCAAGWRRHDGAESTAGDVDHRFALASVTKVLSSLAILVAVQEEIVRLDDPAGPPAATVRLLMSHAAGLPFDGEEPIAPPGRRRSYGNGAFEILGRLVAERAQMPFPDYVDAAVVQPLGMLSTSVDGSPAHGARSTLRDLLRFAGELLAPGRVLAPELLAEATTVQQPELAGVLPGFGRQDPNPWGLGFEIRGDKSPHWTPGTASSRTFGHFGQSGCFLWVDPDARLACVGLSDEPFGDWAPPAWQEMGSSALTAAETVR